MDMNIEQSICLKFCIANGIWCAESLQMLEKAYGESSLWKTRAYEWYSAFKSVRDVVEDLPRSGRPSTSSTQVNIAEVKEMVTENHHLGLRKIAAELSVPHDSIRTIITIVWAWNALLLDYKLWKTMLQSYHCERISGQNLNEYHRTTTVFT